MDSHRRPLPVLNTGSSKPPQLHICLFFRTLAQLSPPPPPRTWSPASKASLAHPPTASPRPSFAASPTSQLGRLEMPVPPFQSSKLWHQRQFHIDQLISFFLLLVSPQFGFQLQFTDSLQTMCFSPCFFHCFFTGLASTMPRVVIGGREVGWDVSRNCFAEQGGSSCPRGG